jgi:UDP-N-acetylmuramoyl-L-alanyl-D-glutamate--2,6-diaminopimelate ligase
MGQAVTRYADRVVVTSDNPRSEDPAAIVDDIKPGLDRSVETEIILDRKDAIRVALAKCADGDTLLVAGKGHEDYMTVGSNRIHFDDREVVRDLLKENGD